MKITLDSILKHIDVIKTACDTFGFQQPQLHRYSDTDYLCFSVQITDKFHKKLASMSEHIRLNLMAFYLTEFFQCKVVVYSETELGNQKEKIGKHINLDASETEIANLFAVKNLTEKTFEKDDELPQNSLGAMKRRKNLKFMQELGLPLLIETTIKKRGYDSVPSEQSSFFSSHRTDQSQQSNTGIEQAAKKLKSIIDNSPELKEAVQKNPGAIFDALKKDYEVKVVVIQNLN